MSEQQSVDRIKTPNTRASIVQSLVNGGILPGSTLLVHSSLSALGWVCGGPVAVVEALLDVITPNGTLVMPTHSGDLSEPSLWQNPPVPESWWQIIRDTMPAYQPELTPTRQMGKIVDVFRNLPGARRSAHPSSSFTAWGKNAEYIASGHQLDYSMGEQSPLARVYDLDGRVLLLGVGFGNHTSFHLAEIRAGGGKIIRQGAPVLINGKRQWVEYDELDYDSSDFIQIGEDFSGSSGISSIRVGDASCYFFSQRASVDFAVEWIKKERA